MPEAVIVSTARSPIGRAFKGSLKDERPDDLAAAMVTAALAKLPSFDAQAGPGRGLDDLAPGARVAEIMDAERRAGVFDRDRYLAFAERAATIKRDSVEFLEAARRDGKTVAGYGAPGKATTFLAYCGIGTDFLSFTADRNIYKQGLLLPGTRIPIRPPEAIFSERPDYVLILPWNLREEIIAQLAGIREWGGKFIVPIPYPVILD